MSGITNLRTLIASLQPKLHDAEYVFVTRPGTKYGDGVELNPIATVQESEGLTLVVRKETALAAGADFDGVFRMITLQVHSSLEAIGLTAAVAGVLAERGISANVIAGFHHDHVFVPATMADDAIAALSAMEADTLPRTHE